MTATVSFKDSHQAEAACRTLFKNLPRRASGAHSERQSSYWLRLADRAVSELGPERVALAVKLARLKGVSFRGVRCDCCGTSLSAPESVAAGRGPKCMAERAA